MKKRTQRIIVIILAVVMLLSVLLPAISMLTGATTITKNDINKIKDKISSTASQIKEVEAKLKSVRNQKEKALDEKSLLDQKISLLNDQIDQTDAAIEEYNGLIAEKEAEITDLEEQEADQYALFCRQVRDMEETGSVSYLSILFSAASFTELLDYAMMISEVMDYHDGVIEALTATRNQLAQAKTELEADLSAQEELKAEQEANRAELEVQEAEVARLIKEIQSSEREYQSTLTSLEEEDKRLDKELAAAEKKYKEQLAALAAQNGEWYWPLPGRTYITSTFDWRYHPITGKWSHHTGTDIPAPSSTAIRAAKAGIVTEVGYSSVYGNYIQISHGNGYSTFYAHMKKKSTLKEGTTVQRGQTIGYVGSTGWSSGNHLHFEVRVNGTRKNALDYYKNMKFTIKD